MGYIINNGINYFGDNSVTLTQAQYDALVDAGTVDPHATYFITDRSGEGGQYAANVLYDNHNSGLSSTNVQSAIDEIAPVKSSIGNIDNVTLSTPAVGDTLVWNGTAWVNGGVQVLTPTINTQQTSFEPYFTDNTQYVRQGNVVFLNFGVTCNSAYDTHPGVLYMSGLPAPKTNNNGSLFYDFIAPFNPTKRVRCMIDNNGNLNIRFGNATDVFDINIFYICV